MPRPRHRTHSTSIKADLKWQNTPITLPRQRINVKVDVIRALVKLDKLDTLDSIENYVKLLGDKLTGFEHRLTETEGLTKEVMNSVTFISDQYDTTSKQKNDEAKTDWRQRN